MEKLTEKKKGSDTRDDAQHQSKNIFTKFE